VIVVDSSVWIDYFNGVATPASDRLDDFLDREPLGVGDLILTEVLQGFRHDRDYRTAKELLTSLMIVDMLGRDLAIKAADNFRSLRKCGITMCKTVDVIIATCCIDKNLSLLYSDRDFGPCRKHLGLRSALHDP
jgi:predicted nucleic acid-binding protein